MLLGGEPLKTNGKAVVEICMGPFCFEQKCVVSDIVDKPLLDCCVIQILLIKE